MNENDRDSAYMNINKARMPKPVDAKGWQDYYWQPSASGGMWRILSTPEAAQFKRLMPNGFSYKDSHWNIPSDRANGYIKPLIGYARLNDELSRMDSEAILAKFPELRPAYEAYLPVFQQFHSMRAAQGMPSYIASARFNRGTQTPEESMNQWLYSLARMKGHADYGTPVMTDAELAPYLQVDSPQGVAAWMDYYGTESTSWMQKNLPTILGALSLVGLSPVAALGKGLGAALGSKALGTAAANAAAASAMGGSGLSAALSSLTGTALDKLGSAAQGLGPMGQSAAGAAAAALTGGSPLLGAAAPMLLKGETGSSESTKTGGTQTMSKLSFKDIFGPAALGAVLNSGSPATGAAAGIGLSLLTGDKVNLPDNTLGNLLKSGLQGYASNKLFGQEGGAGAASAVANTLYNDYIAKGDTEKLGIPQQMMEYLFSGAGGAGVRDTGGGIPWNDLLELMKKRNSEPAPAPQPPPAPAEVPDLYSLYQRYYNQMPAQGQPDLQPLLDLQYESARRRLEQAHIADQQQIDAGLNRRGLYSSGLALQQQTALRQGYNDMLADVSLQNAMQGYQARQAAEQQRRDDALLYAKNAQELLSRGIQPAGAPAQLPQPPAPGKPTPAQDLARNLLDQIAGGGVLYNTGAASGDPAQTGANKPRWGIPEKDLWAGQKKDGTFFNNRLPATGMRTSAPQTRGLKLYSGQPRSGGYFA